MSYSRILTITILIAFQIVACKQDDCEDIMYADQYLNADSFAYQSWQGVQSFIYKDSLGEEYVYTLSTDVEQLLGSLNTGFCEDTSRSITFRTEYFLKRYTATDETAIAFAQFVDFVEQEQDLVVANLVDKIGLSIFNDSIPSNVPISRIVLMTSSKESPYNQIEYNNSSSVTYDSLDIMGKVFYDVYKQRDGSPKLYYTKVDGIVSFTDIKGRKLVLDRVE